MTTRSAERSKWRVVVSSDQRNIRHWIVEETYAVCLAGRRRSSGGGGGGRRRRRMSCGQSVGLDRRSGRGFKETLTLGQPIQTRQSITGDARIRIDTVRRAQLVREIAAIGCSGGSGRRRSSGCCRHGTACRRSSRGHGRQTTGYDASDAGCSCCRVVASTAAAATGSAVRIRRIG